MEELLIGFLLGGKISKLHKSLSDRVGKGSCTKTCFRERNLHSSWPRRPAAKVPGQKKRIGRGGGVMPRLLVLQSDGWEDRTPSKYMNDLNQTNYKITHKLSMFHAVAHIHTNNTLQICNAGVLSVQLFATSADNATQ